MSTLQVGWVDGKVATHTPAQPHLRLITCATPLGPMVRVTPDKLYQWVKDGRWGLACG